LEFQQRIVTVAIFVKKKYVHEVFEIGWIIIMMLLLWLKVLKLVAGG